MRRRHSVLRCGDAERRPFDHPVATDGISTRRAIPRFRRLRRVKLTSYGNPNTAPGPKKVVRLNWDDVSDEELWRFAAADDRDAFEALFARHVTAVYNHCFRRTGSWSAAEDLVSIVFFKAWQQASRVRFAGASVLPWLLAVANNACRNHERSQRRHARLLSRIPPPLPVADHSADVDERIDDERRMRQILEAMSTLSAADQDVLTMCDWAGLSYADVSTALGIPIGTVRSRLSRGRERLRSRVNSEQAGPAVAERHESDPPADLDADRGAPS
jgi:RNA polymerase sigma factor (sigma-70 family)